MTGVGPSGRPPQERQELDRIGCDGCGRWFTTLDGVSMLAAITGPCPDCGGRFALIPPIGSRAGVEVADEGTGVHGKRRSPIDTSGT